MATRKRKNNSQPEAPAAVVQEPPKYPPPRKSSFTKNLAIVLTDDEVRERGIHLAKLYRDIGRMEDDLKELIKERKQDIAKVEMNLAAIADEVREGKRYDDVHCESTMHFDLMRVVDVRLDTGEEIENRPFTNEEAMQYKKPKLPGMEDDRPARASSAVEDVAIVGGEDDVDEGLVIDEDAEEPGDGSEERDFPNPDDDDEPDDDEDEEAESA